MQERRIWVPVYMSDRVFVTASFISTFEADFTLLVDHQIYFWLPENNKKLNKTGVTQEVPFELEVIGKNSDFRGGISMKLKSRSLPIHHDLLRCVTQISDVW